ncbi:MAG: hypothetical protein M0Z63_00040 [Actinomycetota bacterium]|jgi:hypothetical protein|nr:hypothetical protein [Actinomycetota bacterium]MDA8278815.1 hypothetical protein [Actinomycetota bacterium]
MASETISISCDTCVMSGTTTCGDCLVTFLVEGDRSSTGGAVVIGVDEARAMRTLARSGLVSHLRFVQRAAG